MVHDPTNQVIVEIRLEVIVTNTELQDKTTMGKEEYYADIRLDDQLVNVYRQSLGTIGQTVEGQIREHLRRHQELGG